MILNDITQRNFEQYQELLIEKGSEVKAASAYRRIVIEAAEESGIVKNVPNNLLDMLPREVTALTEKIAAHIKKAVEPASGE